MAVYYIDNINGDDKRSGLSPDLAVRDYKNLSVLPGDTLLFKCGTEYREPLFIIGGNDGAPVTYGSYGEGRLPAFYGSVDVSHVEDWEPTDRENELGIVIVGENLDFEAAYTYTFYNDGTVKLVCIVDEEGFFRVMKIATIEQMYVTFEQQNMSRDEVDALFLSVYGMTVEEYVVEGLAGLSIEDIMDTNMDGVYYVDNGFIYMAEEWEEEMTAYAYTLDGDTMMLVNGDSDVLTLTKQS